MSNFLEEFENNFGRLTKGLDFAINLMNEVKDVEGTVTKLIKADNDAPGENTIPADKISQMHGTARELKSKIKLVFDVIEMLIDNIVDFFGWGKADEDAEDEVPAPEVTTEPVQAEAAATDIEV